MIKRIVIFWWFFILLGFYILWCGEINEFLLFGLTVKPSPSNLSNSWVISHGRDFPILDPVAGGYEAGMAYRIYGDRAEYHFKTFFNAKYDLINFKQTALYLGAGAGLLELLKVTKLESSFNFFFGYQGIVGLKIGPHREDKFCFELQFLKSMEKGRGLQINLLAGVRF